ncbi:hypothetical protein WN55_08020 [Dufourea novaeangliae]|uniref:Uncharacterized protein n=1 Tax=Dufourea novaeangliae TaxID=178035 RepID=A0A154P959_DUFNO|nr:hypothetical protein WN55_08020 [Dufourea novaeangliae]
MNYASRSERPRRPLFGETGTQRARGVTGQKRENSADSGASSRGLDLHTAIFIETTR